MLDFFLLLVIHHLGLPVLEAPRNLLGLLLGSQSVGELRRIADLVLGLFEVGFLLVFVVGVIAVLDVLDCGILVLHRRRICANRSSGSVVRIHDIGIFEVVFLLVEIGLASRWFHVVILRDLVRAVRDQVLIRVLSVHVGIFKFRVLAFWLY